MGQYRLSGQVAGVEVNELRKTLGVRPTPYSVGGAVRGVLHVTGALDQPVFSGAHCAAILQGYSCRLPWHKRRRRSRSRRRILQATQAVPLFTHCVVGDYCCNRVNIQLLTPSLQLDSFTQTHLLCQSPIHLLPHLPCGLPLSLHFILPFGLPFGLPSGLPFSVPLTT